MRVHSFAKPWWTKRVHATTIFGAVSCFKVANVGKALMRTGRIGQDNVHGDVSPFVRVPKPFNLTLKCLASLYLPFSRPLRSTLSPCLLNYLALAVNPQKATLSYQLGIADHHTIFKAILPGALRIETSKMSFADIQDNHEAPQRTTDSCKNLIHANQQELQQLASAIQELVKQQEEIAAAAAQAAKDKAEYACLFTAIYIACAFCVILTVAAC